LPRKLPPCALLFHSLPRILGCFFSPLFNKSLFCDKVCPPSIDELLELLFFSSIPFFSYNELFSSFLFFLFFPNHTTIVFLFSLFFAESICIASPSCSDLLRRLLAFPSLAHSFLVLPPGIYSKLQTRRVSPPAFSFFTSQARHVTIFSPPHPWFLEVSGGFFRQPSLEVVFPLSFSLPTP